jgi:hypothetical protein
MLSHVFENLFTKNVHILIRNDVKGKAGSVFFSQFLDNWKSRGFGSISEFVRRSRAWDQRKRGPRFTLPFLCLSLCFSFFCAVDTKLNRSLLQNTVG